MYFMMSYEFFFVTPLVITGIFCLPHNISSEYLLNVGTVLSTLQVLTHLLFSSYNYHPHLTDKENGGTDTYHFYDSLTHSARIHEFLISYYYPFLVNNL